MLASRFPLLAVALLIVSACAVETPGVAPGAKLTCDPVDDRCPAGLTCEPVSRRCIGTNDRTRPLGVACASAQDCEAGFCVDGVCCDGVCSGPCHHCNLEGLAGTCAPVPAGQDPDNECAGDAPCAGVCGGDGACTAAAIGVACGRCGTCTPEGLCNGSCGAYACVDDQCLRSCASDEDCASSAFCDGAGSCQPKLENGSLCERDAMCTSNACVDGRCCATHCTATSQDGCGETGQCLDDGSACELWGTATVCAAATCADGMRTAERTCDGAGQCAPATAAAPCPAGFGCADASGCRSSCTQNLDCAPNRQCHPKESDPSVFECRQQLNGEICSGDAQCASGHCVGGVCCADACVAEDERTCGWTGACDLTPASVNYGECAFHPAGTVCRAQSCTGLNDLTPPQQCVGDGTPCPAGISADCTGGFNCSPDGTRCENSCQVGTHNGCIQSNAWCRDVDGIPTCQVASQQPGEPCALSSDCAGGGHCDSGLCCLGTGTCCSTRASCPADSHTCQNVASCVSESMTYTCPTTGPNAYNCLRTVGTDASCNGKLADACSTFRDAVCPNASCPVTCKVNNAPNDTLCDANTWCDNVSDPSSNIWLCVPKKDDRQTCSRAAECKSGKCQNGFCCTTCCASSLTCPAICDVPTQCQGHHQKCSQGNCTTTIDSVAGDDSACDYKSDTTHLAHCSLSHVSLYCSGRPEQTFTCTSTPVLPCAIGDGTRFVAVGDCDRGYICDTRGAPTLKALAFCKRSCGSRYVVGPVCDWGLCGTGQKCAVVDSTTCTALCE